MMPSEIVDLKNKIRQLQEDIELSHTKTLLSVNRILNTANTSGIISDEQLEHLQSQIKKL